MSVIAWMIVGLVFASVVLGGGETGALRGLLGLGAGALAAVALLGRRLRPLSNTAFGVLLAWIGLAVVQSRFAPTQEGALSTIAVLSALSLFVVAHTAIPRRERELLLVALGLGGTGVAAVALFVMTPGSSASFPLATPDRLGGWLLFPAMLGVTALCFCAPEGRGARWTIGWFAVVSLSAAGIAATRSVAAVSAAAVAASTLLVLSRFPTRRGFAGAVALGGLALAGWIPALDAPFGSVFAEAGFASTSAAPNLDFARSRTAALLLLSAAIVLRRIRPVRRGRGSLAAWGGVGAVFSVASLGLIDSSLEIPAITLTAAILAGLAWPAAAGAGVTDLRRTRAALLLLCAGIVGSVVAGGPWSLGAVP